MKKHTYITAKSVPTVPPKQLITAPRRRTRKQERTSEP